MTTKGTQTLSLLIYDSVSLHSKSEGVHVGVSQSFSFRDSLLSFSAIFWQETGSEATYLIMRYVYVEAILPF